MLDPIFWLGLSFFLVAISLTVMLIVAIPTMQQLTRMSRNAEKLFETLAKELPPTLEAIRNAGQEIIELTEDMTDGVKSAGEVVKQVDRSLTGAKKQVNQLQVTTRTLFTGLKAAWHSFKRTKSGRRTSDHSKPSSHGNSTQRLSPSGGDRLYLDDLSLSKSRDAFSSSYHNDTYSPPFNEEKTEPENLPLNYSSQMVDTTTIQDSLNS